ncbi:MAG: hypothetical protein D6791_09190, partial [Chloroflexi bacterium]
MKKHLFLLLAVFLALTGCGDQPEMPSIVTATPASPSTPAPRDIYPEGEPGGAQVHEAGWTTPVKLRFNDDGWEDSP